MDIKNHARNHWRSRRSPSYLFKRRIARFIAFCLAITIIGCGLALLPGPRHIASTYAARNIPNNDLSVVGPPSLPASTVNSILARLGSPMMGAGALVEQ